MTTTHDTSAVRCDMPLFINSRWELPDLPRSQSFVGSSLVVMVKNLGDRATPIKLK